MKRLNGQARRAWFGGTKREIGAVQDRIEAGSVQCDTCYDTAVAIGHRGTAETVTAECATCFLARRQRERAERPTREQLAARVTRAIAQA